MSDKFDIIAGTNVSCPKTKPQLLQQCINGLNISNSATVLIDDSCYDAIGAQQVGIDFIAVTYGFGFKEKSDVDDYGAVAVCEKAADILQLF